MSRSWNQVAMSGSKASFGMLNYCTNISKRNHCSLETGYMGCMYYQWLHLLLGT